MVVVRQPELDKTFADFIEAWFTVNPLDDDVTLFSWLSRFNRDRRPRKSRVEGERSRSSVLSLIAFL
jgi:hypothetical protein